MLTHIVMFEFTQSESAKEGRDRLLGLIGRVPTLLSLEAHLDVTRSARSYDLVLITHHNDAQGLADYQSHPAHVEVGAWLQAHTSGVVVVDFASSSQ